MPSKRASWTIVSVFFLLGFSIRSGRAEEPAPATLHVMILDENGSLVHGAHVYIFSRNKKKFIGMRDTHATATFHLPEDDYRVYAGRTLNNHGLVDHYVSPEARVHLSLEEPTSIILSLEKAKESELYLSETARQKLGINGELAKYLN